MKLDEFDLKYFTKLKEVNLSSNNLKYIDLSNNIHLKTLILSFNQLETISIDKNI